MPIVTRSISKANQKAPDSTNCSKDHPNDFYKYVRNSDNEIIATIPHYNTTETKSIVKNIFASTPSMIFIPDKNFGRRDLYNLLINFKNVYIVSVIIHRIRKCGHFSIAEK